MKKLIATLLLCLVVVGTFSSLTTASAATSGLSDAEKNSLLYVREEEKLARDVYIVLNGKWNLLILQNIAVSEQKHMDAIKTLLVKYGLPDPAADDTVGAFTNPAFDALFVQLARDGGASKMAALGVGVSIENMDIDDLNAGIAAAAHRDIKTVYGNLLQGSLSHLAAFESNLAKL
jgi:hypothetical protein